MGEGRGVLGLTALSSQHLHIPTMENGPELVLRFQKELSAIQVRCWLGAGLGAWSPEKVRSLDWELAPLP